MRTLRARLRRDRPGRSTLQAFADASGEPTIILPSFNERQLGRADAIAEAIEVMQALGLEPRGPLDVGDLVRFVYAQGWLACEARLASPDMADAIDAALNHPGRVTDKSSTDTINTWTVRALQQAVVGTAGNT